MAKEINSNELDLTGHQLIWNERSRQKSALGFTARRDDGYVLGQLVRVAIYLAAPDTEVEAAAVGGGLPWDPRKARSNRIEQLAQAGALLAAEIDRLRRAEKKARKAAGKAVA